MVVPFNFSGWRPFLCKNTKMAIKCTFHSDFGHISYWYTCFFFCCVWHSCTPKNSLCKKNYLISSKLFILQPYVDFGMKLAAILEDWIEPPGSFKKDFFLHFFWFSTKFHKRLGAFPLTKNPYLPIPNTISMSFCNS